MTSIIIPEYLALIPSILATLGAPLTPETQHMAECVLRSCINHRDEKDPAFISGRVQILMALLRVDGDGFSLHDLNNAVNAILRAQREYYANAERTRNQRREELRTQLAIMRAREDGSATAIAP